MIKARKSLVYLALAAVIGSLAGWLYISPPDLLIGHPVILYGLVLCAIGLIFTGMGVSRLLNLKRNLPSKSTFLFWFLLLAAVSLLFPPDFTRPYYPPAPIDGVPQQRTIIPYPIGLPQANAACPNRCIINVCVRWVPGPSPQCPNPGPGGGCCKAYEQECSSDCGGDPPPPPISPPSISGSVICDQWGSNGWCQKAARLKLTVSDPQSYSLTISGDAGGPFSCSGSCTIALPPGAGTATYTVTASQSGKSASGSSGWKYDPQLPVVDLEIIGTEGLDGWYISPVDVTANGSDSLSGLAGVSLTVDGGSALPSAMLTDGVYTVVLTAADNAGNTASTTRTIMVDTIPPALDLSMDGVSGLNGWYVSPVTITAIVSDFTSGIGSTQYRMDSGEWQDGTSTRVLIDGKHVVDFRVADQAGNETSASLSFKIDMTPPSSSFTSPSATELVMETVQITGMTLEETSGLSSVEIFHEGGTWLPLSPISGNWSSPWDTTVLPNGTYSVFVRGTDLAGNREAPVQIDLVVGNPAPDVRIPFSWMISDPLPITIRPGPVPLYGAQIVIHDPKDRWPARRYTYEPGKIPTLFLWDRRFRDGTLATPGRYRVVVEAWDAFGNTGQATGTLIIPDIPLATATSTPTATVSPSPSPTSRPAKAPTKRPGISAQPPTPATEEQTPLPKLNSVSLWPAVGFLGLLAGLVSASLSDPRPRSLKRMGNTVTRIIDQEKRTLWKG